MRNPDRIEPIIKELRKAWHQPGWEDMRFGQFMSNLFGYIMDDKKLEDIWFPEDDMWLAWLMEWNAKYEAKKRARAEQNNE